MKKYLLFAGAAVLGLCSAASAAINCQTLPSCEELGYAYDASWCVGQKTLKCPFDQNAIYCTNPYKEIECQIGSVLYEDKKCYTSAPRGKSPIGVVFDTSKRLALSLKSPDTLENRRQGTNWGGDGIDIPDLENYTLEAINSSDTDGQTNTDKIIAALGMGNGTNVAAGWCKNIGGFLPSISELKTLYSNKAKVKEGLSSLPDADHLIGEGVYESIYFWSSNEKDDEWAWAMNLYSAKSVAQSAKKTLSYTRCAVAY